VQELTGKVTRDTFAKGSKSERPAVFLETPQASYVLRRAGGNAFMDPALDELVGKTITVCGELHGYTFLIADWRDS
jgi:hypothetical protein